MRSASAACEMPAAIRSRFTFLPTSLRTSSDMSAIGQDVQLIATYYNARNLKARAPIVSTSLKPTTNLNRVGSHEIPYQKDIHGGTNSHHLFGWKSCCRTI